MNDTLYKKIKSFIYFDADNFFDYDEYFELALCISYLTLSKEKIIKKDIKNKDRLGRLNRKVATSEFDKVFDPSFCQETPNIIFSTETDKAWILDNIRDCIMHGVFEVDEAKKCFIINNQKDDRELEAEIPFSWFVAYTKYDILSKKIADKYSFEGFYYNIERKDKDFYKTKEEVFKNIMYKVDITGNKFNIDEISQKIRNIMNETSKKKLSPDLINRYKDKFPHKFLYSDHYLASFAIACEIAKEAIEKEYPGVQVSFKLNDRKHRFANYTEKHLSQLYRNYDVVMKEFDYSKRIKSYELLSYIKKMLINLKPSETDENKWYAINFANNIRNETLIQFIDRFDGLNGDDLRYHDNQNRFKSVSELVLNILINVYGITTLVVNHGEFYNNEFLNILPENLGIKSGSKQPIIDYENLQKNYLEQILNIEIQLSKLRHDYAISPSPNNKKSIKKLEKKLDAKKQKASIPRPPVIIRNNLKYSEEKNEIVTILHEYMNHFHRTNDIEAKQRIRDIILDLYDKKIENELKYLNAKSYNMEETLTIMRNCFSHIGRIYIGKNHGMETTLIMHDYDENNKESGTAILKLRTMIDILNKPFNQGKYSTRK